MYQKIVMNTDRKLLNHSFLRSIFLPLLFGCIYFLINFVTIHSHPLVGMADQGDFPRVFRTLGIGNNVSSSKDDQFSWIKRTYPFVPATFGETLTSELVFVSGARLFSSLLHQQRFDIQLLGFIHSISMASVLCWFFFELQKFHKRLFLIAAPLLLFMLSDSGYTAYFNSGYQEPAALIFLMGGIASLFSLLNAASRRERTKSLCLLSFSFMFLLMGKTQNFILIIPMLTLLWQLKKRYIPIKTVPMVGSLLIVTAIIMALFGTSTVTRQWNVYNTVIGQLLGSTENRNRAAAIVGLPSQFLRYSGIPAHERASGISDPTLAPYLTFQTFLRAELYYVLTPKEFIHTVREVSRSSFTNTVYYLGSYERNSGFPPLTSPQRNNLWGTLKRSLLVSLSPLLPFSLVMGPFVFLWWYRRAQHPILLVLFFLLAAASVQFFLVAGSEALVGGPEKHLFLYDVLFDISSCLFLSQGIVYFLTLRSKKTLG